MVEADPVRFRYEFPPSPASSTFDLAGGDDWLGPITVERVDRPVARRDPAPRQGARRRPPTACASVDDPLPAPALPARHRGRIDARRQREARGHPVEGPSGQPARARSAWTTGRSRPSWTLREATTLEILLTSAETGLSSRPSFLSLGLLRDREPRVTLRAVGVGSHVTPVATIPLTIAATDDIGLAALRLQVDRTVSVEEKDKIEPKTKRDHGPVSASSGPDRARFSIIRSGTTWSCRPIRPRSARCSGSWPRPTIAAPAAPRPAGRACSRSRWSRPMSSFTRS